MGQNMLEAHFGLGTAELADSVSIRWPSGHVQTLTNVTVNHRLIIVEPANRRPDYKLGAWRSPITCIFILYSACGTEK